MRHSRVLGLLSLPLVAILASAVTMVPASAQTQMSQAAGWPKVVSIAGNGGITPSSSDASPQAVASTAVGDLLNNGQEDLVAAFPNGQVWAWTSTGSVLSGFPRDTGGVITGSPTLANLSGNGQLDIVVANHAGDIYVIEPNGANYPGWPKYIPPPAANFPVGFYGSVAVGDLFGNGSLELVAASWDHYLYAWNTSGSNVRGFPINLYDTAWDTPALVDLSGNGTLDIAVGSDSIGPPTEPCAKGGCFQLISNAGKILHRTSTGEVLWSSPAAADLNNNGSQEIVQGTGWYYPEPAGNQDYVFNSSGGIIHNLTTSSQSLASPAIGDVQNNNTNDIVQVTGRVPTGTYIWTASGSTLPGWGPNTSANANQFSSAVIAPLDGSGNNGVWESIGGNLMGFNSAGSLVDKGTLSGGKPSAYGTPTVANLTGQLNAIDIGETTNGNNTAWSVNVFNIPGSPTALASGSWPTFHGNMERTGTASPSSTVNALSSMQTADAFDVSWTTADTGQYTVYVQENGGPWLLWTNTGATAEAFYGVPGTTYGFYVQADESGPAPTSSTTPQTTTTIMSSASAFVPFTGMYTAGIDGSVRPGGSQPLAYTGSWPGKNIVRGIAVDPDGLGGYTLDDGGGVHPFGNATGAAHAEFWPYNIARGIAVDPAKTSQGYIVDGYGGVHPFGGAPPVCVTGYWSGHDIAVDVVLLPNGESGYVLDDEGTLHAFAACTNPTTTGAPPAKANYTVPLPNVIATGVHWPFNIARSVAIIANGNYAAAGGYILNGYGHIYAFGTATPQLASATWSYDIARGVVLLPGNSSAGYTVDGWGHFWPFGGAPRVTAAIVTPGDYDRGLGIGG